VLVGLLGGVGLAFLLENIDPRLYDEKQLENIAKLPVLGSIPSISGWRAKRLIVRRFPYNHAFHHLGINLRFTLQADKSQTIMVTSPEPCEGKSLVAANLAYSLAQTGCNILIVDADLHRPAIHRCFGLPNETGLANLLCSEVAFKDIVHATDLPGLSVITSGSAPENLEELPLDNEQVAKVLEQFTHQYDYVILDTPAFLGLVDSPILSHLVDGVLLVTRLGATRQASLRTTYQQLEKTQANVLGLVINETRQASSTHHYDFRKRQRLLSVLTKSRLFLK
jgi:non-specific protein-tyrosine kinase